MKIWKKIVKLVTWIVCASVFVGCVPVYYYRHTPLHYEPIDSNMIRIDGHVEYVYVPRYKPKPMYYWDGFWYDEPYTYISYRDLRGNTAPRRIPKRIMRDIDHKTTNSQPRKMPEGVKRKGRSKIRRIIRHRNRN